MNDGESRHSAVRKKTRAEQKRTNWLIVSVCVAALIVFVLIFTPLMVLREIDNKRQQQIQLEEYEVADNWTNIFRTRLMDAAYAGYMMEGLVLSGQPKLPNLTAPPEERVKGQYVPKFDVTAKYIFASLSTISQLYLSPGGVINQCYPQACQDGVRDLLNMDDPTNYYTPSAPDVAAGGQLAYIGPIRNNISTTFNMEWVMQARLPIYISNVRSAFNLSTFWGFASTTINITGLIQTEHLHAQMMDLDMDYLFYRVGYRTGRVQVVACWFPGCDADGRGGNDTDAVIPSEEVLTAFIASGSGPMVVMLGSNFTVVVRSRHTPVYTTPSAVATCVMGGVGIALIWVVISVVLTVCCTTEQSGHVSPAPKRAPFAVVTVGPSRADLLWRDAPELMHEVADKFLDYVKTASEKCEAYPVPRVHPYTHSYATRNVTDAIQFAFGMIAWAERAHVDADVRHKLGDGRGRLFIACAVHWCTDASVRLASLSDPFPFRYEGPDVERAGHTWLVAAPNTVTLTQPALDHLEQHEPARGRRTLQVVPYAQARHTTSTSLGMASMTPSVPLPPDALNGSARDDGPLSVPVASAYYSDHSQTRTPTGDPADAAQEAAGATPLYLVTDPQQPLLRRALEVARVHCEAPAKVCASSNVERFEQWNNVRSVSGSSSEAGGCGGAGRAASSRGSLMASDCTTGNGSEMEASTRGVESDLPSPLLMGDSGVGYSPASADVSGASLSVMVPSSAAVSESASTSALGHGDGGRLSSSFGAALSGSSSSNVTISSAVTPLSRSAVRFGRTGSRTTGVVINVSQGVTAALESRDDPLGHAAGLSGPVDLHDVDGTPLTDLHRDTSFSRPFTPSAVMAANTAAAAVAEDEANMGPLSIELPLSSHAPPLRAVPDGRPRGRPMPPAAAATRPRARGGESSDRVEELSDSDRRITAYEAWYPQCAQSSSHHMPRHSDSVGQSSSDHRLHAYTARRTRAYGSGSDTPHSCSSRRSGYRSGARTTHTSDDGDALTQLLLHPPIAKYLDDSLRSAFQYQAVGLPLPYDSVQVLIFYLFSGYKLLFRPLAAVERANIFQRFVVAFGVPSTNTLDHLAAWAAIRYVEQHEETRGVCAPLTRHMAHAAHSLTTTDRQEASRRSELSSSSSPPRGGSAHPSRSNRSDRTGTG